ncbi:MAG: copper ABC transporter ATP-binding protein [Bacteroidetes bacterium HGW-Bacteroidetes-9]|jgi:Cu-processing system ATP-binding protein|nr:MAG: copper ABC transporter ATP-binding protein [Bacteroidetes bacterium HGW-Bacteroidetes-9]
MIEISKLQKRYGRIHALRGIDLNFSPDQVTALVGPNASGKTTLIKCLLGMVIPDGGTIIFDGKTIAGDVGYKNRIGYMPQIGRYPDNMNMGYLFGMMKDLGKGRVNGQFDEDLIEAFILNEMFGKSMRSLSGGTRQKVSAALAFLFKPEVVILDEPTAGLDPMASEILKQKIQKEKEAGKLILITSHIMSEVEEIADSIAYIVEGEAKFYKKITEIKSETGEERLGKALFHLLR